MGFGKENGGDINMSGHLKGSKNGVSKYAELNDPELLRRWYEGDKLSMKEVGRRVGCCSLLVQDALDRHRITRRGVQAEWGRGSKYPELNNEEWLRQKFVNEGLSFSAIAKEVGGKCSHVCVQRALGRFGIIKKLFEKIVESSDYPELNDRDLVVDLYTVQGLSIARIAAIVGAKSTHTVESALRRYGITCRNAREAAIIGREDDHFIFDTFTKSVIDGCLLGDATLHKTNPCSDLQAPTFKKENVGRDHVEFVARLLWSEPPKISETLHGVKMDGTPAKAYVVESLTHDELKPIYREWYRERPGSKNPVKVIPPSVALDPISILHWYLDDGYNSWGNYSAGTTVMGLCSMGFTKEDQEMLVDIVNQKFDVGLYLEKANKGTGWTIKIIADKHNDFLDLIGPCPVPSLRRKFEYDFHSHLWVSPNFSPLKRHRRVDQNLDKSRFPGTDCTLPDRVICPWSLDLNSIPAAA